MWLTIRMSPYEIANLHTIPQHAHIHLKEQSDPRPVCPQEALGPKGALTMFRTSPQQPGRHARKTQSQCASTFWTSSMMSQLRCNRQLKIALSCKCHLVHVSNCAGHFTVAKTLACCAGWTFVVHTRDFFSVSSFFFAWVMSCCPSMHHKHKQTSCGLHTSLNARRLVGDFHPDPH